MKQAHIFIFIISFLFLKNSVLLAQQQIDSVDAREKYGIRVGADLSKPLRSLIDDDYSGFELVGDYRVYENWYAAAELGFDEFFYKEENINGSTKGSYFKLGANYNAYTNWIGMQNEIFAGLRFGFSSFSQQLDGYTVYSHPYFPADIREVNIEYNNLTASWIELQLGTKVEILGNLFLGFHFQLKKRISATEPTNFANLYIPGFHRTYDGSSIGVGYGYSITYLIPFYKK
ncbi:MAG TPA: DUF6048 family protein [Salinimicrobium sp.]|nr:DUF6048 family protein [Salinimicrobium sp.]